MLRIILVQVFVEHVGQTDKKAITFNEMGEGI